MPSGNARKYDSAGKGGLKEAENAASMSDSEGLDAVRTAGLMGILVAVIASVIAAVCTIFGFIGAALRSSGVLTLEEMTGLEEVAAVILLGSLAIAAILGAGVNATLVKPLRRMTFAVERLAAGDFGYRLEEDGCFRLREVGEFAKGYNLAAAELASTEMMRAGFVSDFSHEFRTPINSLSGFAQLLMDDDLSAEERREYASIIVEESERLAGLSERILLLSKMEATSILPDKEEVDVTEQLRRAVIMLEPRLKEKGVAVDLSLDFAKVPGNKAYLAQLWTNLLDNAVKFSPEGGRVCVALYGGRADKGPKAADGEAVVWVSDEGCGMDGATASHIFERFYQGDSSRSSAGAGLGLALCKRIVELHGGSVSVQSAPGRGSVFEVRLPLSDGSGFKE